MSVSTAPEAWKEIDPWWDTLVETRSSAQVPEAVRVLDGRWFEGIERDVDRWWDALVEDHSIVEVDEATRKLDSRMWDGLWRQVDQWWETYSEKQQQEAAELANLLDERNDIWEQSDSRFDVDPLSTDWTAHSHTRGPLRRDVEENWSQWLAHLLRSNGEFVSELFGAEFDVRPDSVQREVYLPALKPEKPDRYADIFLFAGRRGIHIEVKKGDENYEKTPHTAGLVESHHYEKWKHSLLLPEYKTDALEASFEDERIADRERLRIDSKQSGPIEVVFWRDVTAAIRDTLRQGKGTSHWAASAYVFCTLVEQKMLRFNPQAEVADLAKSSDVVRTSASLSVSDGNVGKQLNYLRETGLADNDDR